VNTRSLSMISPSDEAAWRISLPHASDVGHRVLEG
jgi:hypothetical protein